ncbi:MAG: DUF732 domain-containing protein [Mycobacterium sp.]
MVCPRCGFDVGHTRVCPRCGDVDEVIPFTGWRPDPTARHEGRYYVGGRPTNRVRNGSAERTDPFGGQLLPRYVEVPSRDRQGIRSSWLGTAAMTVVIVAVAAIVLGLQLRHHRQETSPDADYLAALRDSDLSGEFNSDANALAHGRQVCRHLDEGNAQQGTLADKIAVDTFCPKFSDGFHILETATVSGVFVLTDAPSDTGISSISSDGTSCQGVGGYSDIGAATALTVKNGQGAILATTALGQGRGDQVTCTFSFSFPITEGEDRYVVSVSHRGEFSYTYDQLQRGGVQIRLGH